jgi:uncharacterized protein (TIGR00255 family)
MTGYGRAGFNFGEETWEVEVGSVNRRGLEVSVSGQSEWSGELEVLVNELVREVIMRGKISVAVRFSMGGGGVFAWDSEAVGASIRQLREQAAALGISFVPDSAVFLRLAELFRSQRFRPPSLSDASVRKTLVDAVRAALASLVQMRVSEGDVLTRDLIARLSVLESLLARIAFVAEGVVPQYRELLLARLRQAGFTLELADERVLKEVALFADRCDISEEVTRLGSHFAQFRALLAEEREVGRNLDFLCQEINREMNTVGSKANNLEITRCVIDGKNELERIREQVQNVE